MIRTTVHLPSVEAYAKWQEGQGDLRTELVRGVVVREPQPGGRHGSLQASLAKHLGIWVDRVGQGVVYTETGFVVSTDPPSVRGPDVAVVLRAHAIDGPGGWIEGAPEVAVEVRSPSGTARERRQKTDEYLAAGARRVWDVDPGARTVTVHRPDGPPRVFREHETLEEPDVLPGFALPLTRLFSR